MSQPPLPGKKSEEREDPPIFFRGEAAVTQATQRTCPVLPPASCMVGLIRDPSSLQFQLS